MNRAYDEVQMISEKTQECILIPTTFIYKASKSMCVCSSIKGQPVNLTHSSVISLNTFLYVMSKHTLL